MTGSDAASDGLASEVAAVEAARERVGRDLDALIGGTRAQVGTTVEKIAYKLAIVGTGAAAGFATSAALKALWKAVRKSDPPDDPTEPGVGWGDAIAWTAATALAVAVAKLAAARGAAVGWEKATGGPPPTRR